MPLSTLPKVCYELNNSGVDAAGFGPTLNVSGYATALLAQGLATESTAEALTCPLTLESAMSLGFWLEVTADTLSAEESVLSGSLDDGSDSLTFGIGGSGGTVTFSASGLSYGSTPSLGYHHFSFTKAANESGKLYIDGVLVASGTIALDASSATGITLGVSYLSGPADQWIMHDGEYSAPDLLYLATPGGIPYASMSAGGGAGAGSSVARFRRRHFMLEGSSWSMQ